MSRRILTAKVIRSARWRIPSCVDLNCSFSKVEGETLRLCVGPTPSFIQSVLRTCLLEQVIGIHHSDHFFCGSTGKAPSIANGSSIGMEKLSGTPGAEYPVVENKRPTLYCAGLDGCATPHSSSFSYSSGTSLVEMCSLPVQAQVGTPSLNATIINLSQQPPRPLSWSFCR